MLSAMPDAHPKRPRPDWRLLMPAMLIIAGAAAWGLKVGPLALADSVGYAVCHQITVRTYVFGDLVMPLCARCSGQYLGAMAGFFMALAWGRLRASGLPSRGMMITLGIFLAVWAFDGVNSYVYLVTGETFLYTPHNILRLATGMLQGVAVSMFFVPFFNQVFWQNTDPRPVLTDWKDLGLLLLLVGILALAVNSRWTPFFYPLALLSTVGAFLLLSLVGMLFVVQILRADNTAESWWDFLVFFVPGMAFAILLIVGLDALRAWGESSFGLSMPK